MSQLTVQTNDIITVNPNIMGGIPVFTGTRVALKTFFDYMETGESINTFLGDFPTVSKKQIFDFISLWKSFLTNEIKEKI